MASGLGQLHGIESSPDFPMGVEDWDALNGADMIADQSAASDPTGGTGVVHMGGSSQGSGSGGSPASISHWSNLLDFRNGPLFWLALATVLYLGLISLHVSAGIGRRR